MKNNFLRIKDILTAYCQPIMPFIRTVIIPAAWFGLYAVVQNLWLSKNLILTTLSIAITIWVLYYELTHPKTMPRKFQSEKTPWLVMGFAFLLMMAMISVENALLKPTGTSANQASLNAIMHVSPYMVLAESAIIAPIFEENIFRRCIIDFNSSVKLIITSIISMSIFVFAHMIGTSWMQIPVVISYLIPTVCLTGIYDYTRDIKYSMVMHCLYNLLASLTVLMH